MNWAYPLTMLLAVLVGALLLRRNQDRLPLNRVQKIGLGLGAFSGSMLASKIPFLFDLTNFPSGPIWFANGKTIMFGIVGGYLGVELAKWMLEIKTKTGDSFAVPVAIAVAIGRIACFFGGCCYGTPTSLPWGVHFSSIDAESMLRRHPTQIYETIFHLIMAAMLFWIYKILYDDDRGQKRWVDAVFRTHLFKLYLLCYMAYRLVSEELRPEVEYAFGLTLYQWGAIGVIPVFLYLWLGSLRPVRYRA